MANRTFIDANYTLVKRQVQLYCAINGAGVGAPALQKWNYPTLGAGTNARTYTAAPTANALPSGAPYPLQYACGSEGVRSVTRTAQGLWTIKLQDNYQRVLQVTQNTMLAGGLGQTLAVGINSTLTDMNAAGGSEIGLTLQDVSGAAADPLSGEVVLLAITLTDATEP